MSHRESTPLLHEQFSIYLGVPLSIFGVIGNLISLIAWTRINKIHNGSAKSASVYLIALATINSALLICFLTYEALPEMWPKLHSDVIFVRYFCYCGYPLYQFLVLASVWIMMGITFNRFIAVVHPLKAETFNSLPATKIIITCTVLFTFLLNIPHFVSKRVHVLSNGTASVVDSPYGSSRGAGLYDTWGQSVVFVVTPWIVVLLFTGLIIRNILFRTRKQKHKKSGSRRTEYRTTMTVVWISCTFVVLFLWEWITSCFWNFKYGMDDPKIWSAVSAAYAPARLGFVINASLSFLIFCLSSSFFRKELSRMFCYGGTRRNYKHFSHTTNTTLAKRKRKSNPLVEGYENGVVVEESGDSDGESEEFEDNDEEPEEQQTPIHQIS